MKRRLFHAAALLSLSLWLAVAAVWLRTEAQGRTEVFTWTTTGVYRCLEFSGDDAKYKVLRDPGYVAQPLRWKSLRRGWARPPGPSNPPALPATSQTWVLPYPSLDERLGAPSTKGGVHDLGFEVASYPGWYGPGTSLVSYRLSYFLVLIPAAVLPLLWLSRFTFTRWRYGRHGPGHCPTCGYDLRGSPAPGTPGSDPGTGSGTPSKTCSECGAASSSGRRETNPA
jgi:hypothetical protein